MSTIRTLTRGCEKDCSISDLGSETTLIGWTPSYDKNGRRQGFDPNTHTAHYRCSTCGASWKVKTGGGRAKPEIVKTYQRI